MGKKLPKKLADEDTLQFYLETKSNNGSADKLSNWP